MMRVVLCGRNKTWNKLKETFYVGLDVIEKEGSSARNRWSFKERNL